MAVGDSTIRVNIIGDARKLIGALDTADQRTGGLLKSGAKILAAGAVIKKGFDVIGDALDNADRVGDATSRIQLSIGETDAGKLSSIAGSFTDIGISSPDFLEISAGFAEVAKSSTTLDASAIADMAPAVAEFAGAMGRLKDKDPAQIGDDIAKFISGTRGAKGAALELGLPFDEALTPAQRYQQIVDALPGALDKVTGANQGLDDKQSALMAKYETFTAEVGPGVEDALSGILDFILDEIDAIPHAIQGWQDLGRAIEGFGRTALGPLGNVRDALEGILNLLGQVGDNIGIGGGSFDENAIRRAQQNQAERNGLSRATGPR